MRVWRGAFAGPLHFDVGGVHLRWLLPLFAACASAPTPPGDKADTDDPVTVDDQLALTLLNDDSERVYVARTTEWDVDGAVTIGNDGLEGLLAYRTVVDGDVVCDAAVALSGTGWSADCEDCDFAFAVDGQIVEDAGTEDCLLFGPLSLTSDTVWRDFRLAWWSEGEERGDEGTIVPTLDVTRVSYLLDYDAYGGGTYGPYWWTFATERSETRGLQRADDTVVWWMDETVEAVAPTWFSDCGGLSGTVLELPAAVGASAMGETDCEGVVADRWTFEANAGETLLLAADTVSADTAADLAFFVNDPDGCTMTFADDSFECSFAPTQHACPSVSIPVTATGIHQVIVWSYGSCVGDRAGYSLAAWTIDAL